MGVSDAYSKTGISIPVRLFRSCDTKHELALIEVEQHGEFLGHFKIALCCTNFVTMVLNLSA